QVSRSVVRLLAREAALAKQDEEFLHPQAIKLAARIVLEVDDDISLDAAGLRDASPALGSRVVLGALERLAGRKPITFEHVEAVLGLAARIEDGAAISLPGQYAIRTSGAILLRRGRSRLPEAQNSFALSLSIPGEVELGPQRLAVAAERFVAGAA